MRSWRSVYVALLAVVFALAFSALLLLHMSENHLADRWDIYDTIDGIVWGSLPQWHFSGQTEHLRGVIYIYADPWMGVISLSLCLHLRCGPVLGQNLAAFPRRKGCWK